MGRAPIKLLIFWISDVGPAIRDVPVSAMAWHPPAQKVCPFMLMLWRKKSKTCNSSPLACVAYTFLLGLEMVMPDKWKSTSGWLICINGPLIITIPVLQICYKQSNHSNEPVHLELPVSLLWDRKECEVTLVVFGVTATQKKFTTCRSLGVPENHKQNIQTNLESRGK